MALGWEAWSQFLVCPGRHLAAAVGDFLRGDWDVGITREQIQRHCKKPLFDHQFAGVVKMLEDRTGYGNFSTMGTGKTCMAITAMGILQQSLGREIKVLIVCPNTIKENWRDEIGAMAAYPWSAWVLDGPSSNRIVTVQGYKGQVLITNFESLAKLVPALNAWGPDLVIADEAHKIKNHKAITSKSIKAIKTSHRWAMTGTPLVQSVLDVWSIFDWIRPGHLGLNYYSFRAQHAEIYTGGGFPIIKKFKNLAPLKQKVDRYSYRVIKEDCLDLPPKSFQTIHVEMSAAEKQAYKDMVEELILEVGDQTVTATTMLTKMMKLQQLTSGFIIDATGKVLKIGDSKLKALEELLESMAGDKIVVWCKFKHEVELIKSLLASTGRETFVMTGDTPQDERQGIVKNFQSTKSPCVMVGNVATGGVGITLTAASHCVYFSNTWSLADRLQSEDRLHRIGQKNAVNYYDLIAKGTIDNYIMSIIRKKSEMSDKLTGDDLRKMAGGIDD